MAAAHWVRGLAGLLLLSTLGCGELSTPGTSLRQDPIAVAFRDPNDDSVTLSRPLDTAAASGGRENESGVQETTPTLSFGPDGTCVTSTAEDCEPTAVPPANAGPTDAGIPDGSAPECTLDSDCELLDACQRAECSDRGTCVSVAVEDCVPCNSALGCSPYEVIIENVSGVSLQSVPVTVGHSFRVGEFNGETVFSGRIKETNELVTVQADQRVFHEDGSLRFAILSFRLREIPTKGTATLVFLPQGNTAPDGLLPQLVSLDEVRAFHNVSITAEMSDGAFYGVELSDLYNQPVGSPWLEGAEAGEWMFESALGAFEPSGAHPHLTARFYVRKYAGSTNIKTDIVIENTRTFVQNPGLFAYNLSISVNGESVARYEVSPHRPQTRWKRTVWSEGAPEVHVQHNAVTLMGTNAVPSYDISRRGRFNASEGTGAVEIPPGELGTEFSSANELKTRGPLPDFSVEYLLKQGLQGKGRMLALAEAAGGWVGHYRDEDNNGYPANLYDFRTNLSVHSSGNVNLDRPACFPDRSVPNDCTTDMGGTGLSSNNQAALGYLAYLVTGDHFYLEELHFRVVRKQILAPSTSWSSRVVAFGALAPEVWAWYLRDLGRLAFISPKRENDVTRARDMLNETIEVMESMDSGGNPITSSGTQANRDTGNDYLGWALAELVAMGFENARPLANEVALAATQRVSATRGSSHLATSAAFDLEVEGSRDAFLELCAARADNSLENPLENAPQLDVVVARKCRIEGDCCP